MQLYIPSFLGKVLSTYNIPKAKIKNNKTSLNVLLNTILILYKKQNTP